MGAIFQGAFIRFTEFSSEPGGRTSIIGQRVPPCAQLLRPSGLPHLSMAMKRIHSKQLTLALSMTGAMLLAAAVLVWGSEYKCSLYHKHPEKHARIPVAKLLSERERVAAAQ